MNEGWDSQTLFDFGVSRSARTFFEEDEIALVGNNANFASAQQVFQKFVIFAILVDRAINDVFAFANRFAKTIQRYS